MKIHPIELAYKNMTPSIKNTAMGYKEGTNILVRCLAANAKREECEVVDWMKDSGIDFKGLDTYKLCDD